MFHNLLLTLFLTFISYGCNDKHHFELNVIEKYMWIDLMPKINGHTKIFTTLDLEIKNISKDNLSIDSIGFFIQSKNRKDNHIFNGIQFSHELPVIINSNQKIKSHLRAELKSIEILMNSKEDEFNGFVCLYFSHREKLITEIYSIGHVRLEKVY